MFSKLREKSLKRIQEHGTLTGLDSREFLGTHVDEGAGEAGVSTDGNDLKNKGTGVEKLKGVENKVTVEVYSFIDKLRNTNPNNVGALSVILLELLITGELDRIENVDLPDDTKKKIVKLFSDLQSEIGRVLG